MIQDRRSSNGEAMQRARASLLHGSKNGSLSIGIVNNMSGAALYTTTRQFCDLLLDAAQGLDIRVKTVSPFVHSRSETADSAVLRQGGTMEELLVGKFDGLIVTGAEPRASRLIDEPCLPFFAKLVEWSENNVLSTVWSCLATQAAVYHLDGLERRPLGAKLSGIFECARSEHHVIFEGYPSQWMVPHSRYNDLPEDVLISHGYQVLTRSRVAGVDAFTKKHKGLHFFFQGHLEYDAGALAREYRRDVRRFLARETDRYPDLPAGYFSKATSVALSDFRKQVLGNRSLDALTNYPREARLPDQKAPWRPLAIQFYRNWLTDLASRKAVQVGDPGNCYFKVGTSA